MKKYLILAILLLNTSIYAQDTLYFQIAQKDTFFVRYDTTKSNIQHAFVDYSLYNVYKVTKTYDSPFSNSDYSEHFTFIKQVEISMVDTLYDSTYVCPVCNSNSIEFATLSSPNRTSNFFGYIEFTHPFYYDAICRNCKNKYIRRKYLIKRNNK